MVFCTKCNAEVDVEETEGGNICCVQCGKVLDENAFASDVQFAKGLDGEGEMVGQFVNESGQARGIRISNGRAYMGGGDSHEASSSRGREVIRAMVDHFKIAPHGEVVEASHRLYRIALQRGFTRGRRVQQVAAVCVYLFCRVETKPYMLIDFAEFLSINVFALGSVYLQLLRLLRLDEHAQFTKPIDPSLFLHRFVDKLGLEQETKQRVNSTAMKLVQSMKRDWMLTGRRPSGICGAALFLAAHIHGVEKTKKDVIGIVHIGWSTVERRVRELAETTIGEMNLQQLEQHALQIESSQDRLLLEHEQSNLTQPPPQPHLPALLALGDAAAAHGAYGTADEEGNQQGEAGGHELATVQDPNEIGRYCEHARAGAPVFAFSMCRGCFQDYLKSSGGVVQGASDPPAWMHNLRRDIKKRVRQQVMAQQALAEEGEELLLRNDDDEEDATGAAARHLDNEMAAEEQEFDEALNSTEMQPVARALGGAAAAAADVAAATTPDEEAVVARSGAAAVPSGRGTAVQAPGRPDAAAAGATAGPTDGTHEGATTTAAAVGAGAGPSSAEAAAAAAGALVPHLGATPGPGPGREGEAQLAGTKAPQAPGPSQQQQQEQRQQRRRQEQGDEDEEDMDGEQQPDEGEQEPSEETDNLSDVGDEDVEAYLASREEAEVREQLWTEMNKEWLEKQAAKEAAARDAAAACGADGAPAPRTKRQYTRRAKPLAPADDAAGAVRNVLENKKLSSKVNYEKLDDLFGGAGDGGGSGPSSRGGSMAPDFGPSGGVGPSAGRGLGGGGSSRLMAAFDDDDFGEPPAKRTAVAAALAKRAQERAQAKAADADRYAAALEEEERRRGGGASGGLGGGVGGGFLDSLTFAKGGSGPGPAGGARSRPMSLGSLKPRGR